MDTKLIIKELKKKFEKKEVLKNINFEFEKGKIYGLLGRNGAGKTTLFNCISNEMNYDAGKCYILEDGKERDIGDDEIGYVVSTPNVPEFLTGREFLKFFIDINKKNIKNLKTIDEYFNYLQIDEVDRNKLLKDYSHGMKSKMQMLINIISSSNILLLDEPLTSLDVVMAEEMKQMLKSIKNEHIIIFSTHIMELALSLCDEIVILNNGYVEKIERENMNNEEFKDKIIKALKEE